MAEDVPSPTQLATPQPFTASAFTPSTLRGWAIFQRAVNGTLPDALAKSKQFRNLTLDTLRRIG